MAEDSGRCPSCGAERVCLASADCWCMARDPELPALPVPATGGACLCPDCLEKARRVAALRAEAG